ncbi:hypothetical protein ACFL1S_03270 [Pseudomonadota bacterium]
MIYFLATALLVAPFAAQMPPGYDAGLYHLPHQLWLRSEPIVIGLANFHGRFGFGSLLEYIPAPFWINESYKLLSYFQAAFLVFFLLLLLYAAQTSRSRHLLLVLGVLLNIAVFHDYIPRIYTSSDLPAGLLFAATFVYGHHLSCLQANKFERPLGCFRAALPVVDFYENLDHSRSVVVRNVDGLSLVGQEKCLSGMPYRRIRTLFDCYSMVDRKYPGERMPVISGGGFMLQRDMVHAKQRRR